MGAAYLWFVKVYWFDEDEYDFEEYHQGKWIRQPDRDRTFKNKINAMEYAASIRRKYGWHANVIKWYGD